MVRKQFETVEKLQHALHGGGYIANDGLSVSLFLALAKSRPLFLEGEARFCCWGAAAGRRRLPSMEK